MQKTLLLVPILALAPVFPTLAQKTEPKTALPLRQVVLFSSGVGYFGRAGKVNGNAAVDLNFRAPQISDILKSLVLFDPKGKVQPVTYSISDFLAGRATETDLNLDPNASPGALLKSLQGALIRLEKGATVIEGRVVSVSSTQVKEGENYFRNVEAVTLLTKTGVQTVRLDDVTSFSPVDPLLRAKFAASLEKRAANLTSKLDDGVRPVTLRFAGKGVRDVRAGYLQETPTWKTSYRLILAPKTKPYLQGWAVVENPTDEDWSDVQLSLVSGRPISFIQNIATPLYITRPVIDDIIPNSSPIPQTFGAGFGNPNAQLAFDADGERESLKKRLSQVPALARQNLAARAGGIFSNSGAYNAPAIDGLRLDMKEAVSNSRVESAASGSEKGDLFVYAIDAAVTLPRGQAAMVPIVGQDVEGETLSIVESQNQVATLVPTNGFCLRNKGNLYLQGGPITVYSDGIYGGDALVSNVSPGESRLISYALDLDLVARFDREENDSLITGISGDDGVLTISRRATKSQFYALRNKTKVLKTVLIQQPVLPDWKLVDAKQLYEKSNEGWRFKTEVAAGSSKEYEIKWQRELGETIVVRELNASQVAFYAAQKSLPEPLKKALQKVIALKKEAAQAAGARAGQEKTLADIQSDQERIRENMRVLNQESALYKTYATKLAAQEAQIEKIRTEIERLRELEKRASAAAALAF